MSSNKQLIKFFTIDDNKKIIQMSEYNWTDEWFNVNIIPSSTDDKKNKLCLHDWKEYIGFTERYWYCEKCDAKSEEDPNYKPRF